jgi:hypothetical protein
MERTLRSSYEKAAAAEKAARDNHYESETIAESFWKSAAASLPPHVRRKYAHLFEAAERYEPVVDFIVDRCRAACSRLKIQGSWFKVLRRI